MVGPEERERVRRRLLELARADGRVVAGAALGSTAHGDGDRWSDLDLSFGLADGAAVEDVLADWTATLATELDAARLFDLTAGAATYRVFLLPGCLQVDLSFAPGRAFGARGSAFELLFGEAVDLPRPEPPDPAHVFGLAVHHVVRTRVSLERDRLWQAEYWLSAARDHALELACLDRGLRSDHGRGFDALPPELLAEAAGALAGSLVRGELLRALAVVVDLLLREAPDALPPGIEADLRALAVRDE